MTTVSYALDADVVAGTVKVEWSGLSANDDGQPFDCTGLHIASIQASGNFGSGGNMYLYASNEISPSNFNQWQKIDNPSIGEADAMFASIKPVADANIASANVAVLFTRA